MTNHVDDNDVGSDDVHRAGGLASGMRKVIMTMRMMKLMMMGLMTMMVMTVKMMRVTMIISTRQVVVWLVSSECTSEETFG